MDIIERVASDRSHEIRTVNGPLPVVCAQSGLGEACTEAVGRDAQISPVDLARSPDILIFQRWHV